MTTDSSSLQTHQLDMFSFLLAQSDAIYKQMDPIQSNLDVHDLHPIQSNLIHKYMAGL